MTEQFDQEPARVGDLLEDALPESGPAAPKPQGCEHMPRHDLLHDDGIELIEATDQYERVRHPVAGYRAVQRQDQEPSCEWQEELCTGSRYYSVRELFDLREQAVRPSREPARAGYAPCGVCQPGMLALFVNRLQDADLTYDREARGIYFTAQGEWPQRKLPKGGTTREPLNGETAPSQTQDAQADQPRPWAAEL